MAYTTIDKPSDYFNTVTYTGNGSTQSITGVGFQPDWVWIKSRSQAVNHYGYDSVRGTDKRLQQNITNAESTTDTTWFNSFDTDGFTIGSEANINNSSSTYASWNWLAGGTASSNTDGSITSSVSANTTAGFSIVSYTGTGANATIGHGISTPSMIITKDRGNTEHWSCYNKNLSAGYNIYLNLTNAEDDNSTLYTTTAPTSSVYSVGTNNRTNGSGRNYIAYCFSEVKGYSKFGSYTGNGNADGTFVYTGFKPAFVMVKATSDAGESWVIHDNKRDPHNVCGLRLFANLTNADTTNSDSGGLDFLSNGFKCRTNDHSTNESGQTRIFMAFAESPFVTSTGIPTIAR